MTAARNRYEFGGFTLNHGNWTLHGPDGALVPLTPKAFDALIFFLEHAGEVVDRATLIELLWPDTVVEENNLRQVIAALRRAIGDDLIRTVPRRGYEFVAAVRVLEDDAVAKHASTSGTRASRIAIWAGALAVTLLVVAVAFWLDTGGSPDTPTRRTGLAVLPFTDTSPEGEFETVADALAIELTTTLSLIDGLDVPGTTSTFYFEDHPADPATIGEMLGVDYLLEGDVRGTGDQLRISVRLTNAGSGLQIWNKSYDRIFDDFFVLQDEIARTTAQALEIKLGVGSLGTRLGTTRNPDAFFALVEAGRIMRRGNRFEAADIRAAIPYLERAVALDEDFAIGWFELYSQYRWLEILAMETGGSEPGAAERAEFALERVEALTPNLPELVIWKLETSADAHDIARAMEQVLSEAAVVSYPPWVLAEIEARYLRFTGRLRESTAAAERARTLDPLNQSLIGLLAEGYSAEGRHDEGLALIDESVRINGPSPGLTGTAFVIALQQGNPEELERRAQAMSRSPTAITRSLVRYIDDPAQGLPLLRDFVASPDPTMVLWPTMLSPWAAYFGDDELVLEMYRQEVPYATGNTISRPIFAGMRRLPGFRDLVRDVGLLSYWRESGNWPDYCRPLEREEFECF
ncbi:MAG: winged helix-turn-helix domain-containing protein [Gammaproteobacteria bacterium]